MIRASYPSRQPRAWPWIAACCALAALSALAIPAAGRLTGGHLSAAARPAVFPAATPAGAATAAPAEPAPTLPPDWNWISALLAASMGGLAVLVLHGIRERRHLTDALARARSDHEAAIRAIAERQNLETLGRLTAGVAHDMGNVLQAVEFYLRSIPGTLDDRDATLRLVERARAAARRGATGARDLLALARGSAQSPVPTDIRPLLTELSEVMQELLGGAFTVRLDLPPALPHVLADPGDLEAMLINLATNSRDAMAGAGRGTLAISAALVGSPDAGETPSQLPGGEWVRIIVADTGIGMAPDVLERAMEPFFTTKPRGRGTGLGLALAREFAQRSGGMLRIESVPGTGTRASLFLHPASETRLDAATDPSLGATGSTALPDATGSAGNLHARG